MNFLQIWIGDKPEKQILKCIKTVLNQVKETDQYILIAEKQFLKNDKITFININDYVTNELSKLPNVLKAYNLIPEQYKWAKADIIRFHFLSKFPNTLYCDTDIDLKCVPQFDETKIYFGNLNRMFDCFIIYNGLQIIPFFDLLNSIVNKYNYMIERNKIVNDMHRDWNFEIINKSPFSDKLTSIPSDSYKHLGMWKIRGN